jgi:hypothetical protein
MAKKFGLLLALATPRLKREIYRWLGDLVRKILKMALIDCPNCSRSNAPTRTTCTYCGQAIAVKKGAGLNGFSGQVLTDKMAKNKWTVGAILCLIFFGGFWIYRSIDEQNFRVETLKTFVEIRADLDGLKAVETRWRFFGGSTDDLMKNSDKIILVRDRFHALEKSVKERNGGGLPSWIKDDRVWKFLNQEFPYQ